MARSRRRRNTFGRLPEARGRDTLKSRQNARNPHLVCARAVSLSRALRLTWDGVDW
jgi:hypothetical protein